MPRVLITGAAGFIGMHTSIRFLEEGWYVLGIDNLNDYYDKRLKWDRLKQIESATTNKARFTFLQEDITSEVWNDISSIHFDALIHLAAQAGVRYSIENPNAYLTSNIFGFQKVLEFVVKSGIERFLYASSSSVYGKSSSQPFSEQQPCDQPESYYAATKRANELMAYSYAKTHGLKSIGMRFFTVYGPWGRPDMAPMLFTNAAMNSKEIRVFNYGKQKRDFTYVEDIVEGIYRLTIKKTYDGNYNVCNIGNGSPVDLFKFIDFIETYVGMKIKRKMVDAQPGDVEVTYASTQKLKELISYEPKVSLDVGIMRFVEWYKGYYK